MKTIKELNKTQLLGIPIPQKTESYSPVGHTALLDFVERSINTQTNFRIKNLGISSTNNGDKIIARYDLDGGGDPDLGNRLYIRNSYDKSASLLIVAGAEVFVCSNGLILNAEQFYRRKHTGEIWLDIKMQLSEILNILDTNLRNSIEAKLQLQQAPLMNPIDQVSNMLGHMFYKEEIITSVQLNEMTRELKSSTKFNTIDSDRFTMWDFYNAGTQALKRTHPSEYIEKHQDLHKFMMQQSMEAVYV